MRLFKYCWLVFSFIVTVGFAQPVITSLTQDGKLSWVNEKVHDTYVYRVEWASNMNGPWYRNFDNLNYVMAGTETNFTVEVPKFFRVVMDKGNWIHNVNHFGMVWIEEGKFIMGNRHNEAYETSPAHEVYVDGFWIERTEVPLGYYQRVKNWGSLNGYEWDMASTDVAEWATWSNDPATIVTWHDAVKFCNARSQMEELTPCYYLHDGSVFKKGLPRPGSDIFAKWDGDGYRLPTEAEWEKAARGRNIRDPYHFGEWRDPEMANFQYSPKAVGSYPPNQYGVHDMVGNLAEWCWDYYSPGYYTNGIFAHKNPKGPDYGNKRVYRGLPKDKPSLTYRSKGYPTWKSIDDGWFYTVRCVRSK